MSQLDPPVPLYAFCGILVIVALKHYVADFVLQTHWIARGKELREGWQAPLAVHALSHAALTLAIALAIAPRLWWLAGVDFVVHGAIDRGKSLTSLWGRWQTAQAPYWWLMGFDQFLHQATNIAFAAALFVL